MKYDGDDVFRRYGGGGIQRLLLLARLSGHTRDGVFHKETALPGGPGVQL